MNKAKRFAIMAYCLYYRGITISQILLAKMSDSADASVIRATMSKYSTTDIRCSIVSKNHVAADVSGRIPVAESDTKKPYYMHQIRYGKQRINVYELSMYGIQSCIYELLELPAEFLAGVTKQDLEQLGRAYRKRKSLSLSDEAAHLLATRDFGAFCCGTLNFRQAVYHTECRFFANGEFISSCHAASHHNANASTVQISDGYIELLLPSQNSFKTQSVYVEQDMGTQSRSYIRKNKLLHYLDFVRYSFRKHPALVTVLFSLQTRADYRYPKEAPEASFPASSARYAPSLRQEIIIRSYENFGERWADTLLTELHRVTSNTLRNCPQVHVHLQNELELFETLLCDHPYATISDLLDHIGSDNRRNPSSAAVFSAGDLLYYHQRRLEIFEESQRISGFRDMLLEGFSVMFVPNKALAKRIPCLMPFVSPDYAMHHNSFCSDAMQPVSADRLCHILSAITGRYIPNLEYKPYVSSANQLFRNYYFNESMDVHLIIENLSDDLGGRARVHEYLYSPDFSLFSGIMLCVVEDDWLTCDSLSGKRYQTDALWPRIKDSTYVHYLSDAKKGDLSACERLSLRVCFITYRSFLSDNGTILELTIQDGNAALSEAKEVAWTS